MAIPTEQQTREMDDVGSASPLIVAEEECVDDGTDHETHRELEEAMMSVDGVEERVVQLESSTAYDEEADEHIDHKAKKFEVAKENECQDDDDDDDMEEDAEDDNKENVEVEEGQAKIDEVKNVDEEGNEKDDDEEEAEVVEEEAEDAQEEAEVAEEEAEDAQEENEVVEEEVDEAKTIGKSQEAIANEKGKCARTKKTEGENEVEECADDAEIEKEDEVDVEEDVIMADDDAGAEASTSRTATAQVSRPMVRGKGKKAFAALHMSKMALAKKKASKGISLAGLRRLIKRGAVAYCRADVYDVVQGLIENYVAGIVDKACIIALANGKKTLSLPALEYALGQNGRKVLD